MAHENAKIRLIAVYRMLEGGEKMTAKQICLRLRTQYGITADRKTIYSDVYAINRIIPIEATCGWYGGYQRIDVLGRCEDG